MRRFLTGLLPCLLPASALAGAQYTAEDVIRYFQEANAAAAASGPSVARAAPASSRGIVVGDPAAQALPDGAGRGAGPGAGDAAGATEGVVVGNAPRPALPTVGTGGGSQPAVPVATSGGEAPLVIPMTGAKAGHRVAPADATPAAAVAATQPAGTAVASVAEPVGAAGPAGGGYDMLVTFELDSATLTPQARQNLEAFARALVSPALSALRFAVEGHTDASGSAEYNLELSERRAASVVAYLVENGVAADRLTGQGFGETRPRVADPEHPENRRVETRPLN